VCCENPSAFGQSLRSSSRIDSEWGKKQSRVPGERRLGKNILLVSSLVSSSKMRGLSVLRLAAFAALLETASSFLPGSSNVALLLKRPACGVHQDSQRRISCSRQQGLPFVMCKAGGKNEENSFSSIHRRSLLASGMAWLSLFSISPAAYAYEAVPVQDGAGFYEVPKQWQVILDFY
jgi:hypothetical protein